MAIEQGRERPLQENMAARPGEWARGLVRSPLALVLVIFLLALWLRVTDLDVFVGPDEFSWVTRTANFAQAVTSGDFARTYQTGHPGVMLMWAETVGAWLRYGGQVLAGGPADWPAITGPDKTMVTLAVKRQVIGVSNAIMVALIALLAGRLFGPAVGWLSGFLLAFDPFLLAESRVLRPEGTVTGFTSLGLLALLLYLKERRLAFSALAGVLAGMALLSKVSAAALLPLGVLMIAGASLLDRSLPWRRRWREAAVRLAVWGGLVLVTVWLLWPALWVTPVEVARNMAGYVGLRVTEGNAGDTGFFLGQPRADEEVGLLFYPVVLLYRTGPLLWLGLILLVAAWAGRRLAAWPKLALAVLLLFLALYLAQISSSTLKYDRFIIPMLPSLAVMAALGLVTARRWLGARLPGLEHPAWGLGLPLLVLAGQAALALPHHPYYYTYWNPLLGGLRQAVRVLPVAEGEGLDQVADYLNRLPDAGQIRLASGNSQKLRPLFKGETIALANLDGEWVLGDYVLIYISQLQRAKHDPNILAYLRRQPPVHTVTLHGLEYAWLYPGPAAQYYGGGHTLEGRGTLYGYSLDRTDLAAGQPLAMTLYWRNEGRQPDDLFFVRMVDLAGYVWAEALAQPRPSFEEASRQRESILESELALDLPIGMPPGEYFLKPGFRTGAGQLIGLFPLPEDAPRIRVTQPAVYPAPGEWQPPHPARLAVNGELALAGYDLDSDSLAPGSEGWLTLYWQALAGVGHDYVILVRLLDEQGGELAYWLGRPVMSGYPTLGWQAGQIVLDPWLLAVPAGAGPGVYDLEIALFEAETETEVGRQRVGQVRIE